MSVISSEVSLTSTRLSGDKFNGSQVVGGGGRYLISGYLVRRGEGDFHVIWQVSSGWGVQCFKDAITRVFWTAAQGCYLENVNFGRKNMDQLSARAVIRQLIDNIFTRDIKSAVEVCMRQRRTGQRCTCLNNCTCIAGAARPVWLLHPHTIW